MMEQSDRLLSSERQRAIGFQQYVSNCITLDAGEIREVSKPKFVSKPTTSLRNRTSKYKQSKVAEIKRAKVLN